MIKEQFLYFARYPAKSGIRAILTNGSSDFPGYATCFQHSMPYPNSRASPR